jgi:hypothetical protein
LIQAAKNARRHILVKLAGAGVAVEAVDAVQVDLLKKAAER